MRVLLPLAILLLAALGGTLWLFSSTDGEAAPALEIGGAQAPSPEGGPAGEALTLEMPGEGTAPASTPRARVREAAASPDDPAARPTRIRGRLVDVLGRGVGDARVAVLPAGSRLGLVLGEAADALGELRTSTSARDGRFTIALEPWAPDDLELSVTARGYAPFRRSVHTLPGQEVSLGDLALDRGVILGGRVLDEGGRPVAGARLLRPVEPEGGGLVILRPGGGGELVATTDAQGAFEVASQRVGEWELWVRHGEHPDQLVQGTTEHPGDHRTDLLVVLEDGFLIRGVLEGVPDEERGRVEVRAWGGGGQRDVLTFTTLPQTTTAVGAPRTAPVEPDGSFLLRGLREGQTYRLHARVRGAGPFGRGGRSETVEARAGDRGVELLWSLGAVVALRVADGRSGEPLEDFTIEAGLGWRLPLADEDGGRRNHFEGGLVRIDGLWPRAGMEDFSFQIEAPGYEPLMRQGIRLAPSETLDLGTLRLTPMPRVRVTVLDETSGEPVAGARVGLRAVSERKTLSVRMQLGDDGDGGGGPPLHWESDQRQGLTDERGVCELSSFPGRSAILSVEADDHAPYREQDISLPLREDLEREVRLGAGGSVLVTVVDGDGSPVAALEVDHRSATEAASPVWGGGPGRRTDPRGRVRFAHLAPGSHSFRVRDENPAQGGLMLQVALPVDEPGQGQSWRSTLVVGGSETELELLAPARGSLHGIITEDGRPLSSARVVLVDEDDPRASFGSMFGGQTSATTDGQGRYAFEDLKLADYRVEVRHPTRVMAHEVPLRLEEGENKLSLDLPVCILEGRVTDEAGEPMAGAAVTVTRREKREGQGFRIMMLATDDDEGGVSISTGEDHGPTTASDEDGHYSLRGVAADQELFVLVRAEGYEPTTSEAVRLLPGELRRHVDLQLGRGGTLIVRVTTHAGEPADGLIAVATFQGESEVVVPPAAAPVVGGQARLEDLVAGPWSVGLNPAGGLAEPPPMPDPRTAEVESGGEALVEFELPD